MFSLQINLSDNALCGITFGGRGTYTDVGIKAIADAMAVSHSLTQVCPTFRLIAFPALPAPVELTLTWCCLFLIPQINLRGNKLGPEGAKALAPAIRDSHSLTAVDTRANGIDGEGAEQLAVAVLGSSSMVTFGEIPIKELRADALTTLHLSNKELGPAEALVLAGLLPVSHSLNSIDVGGNRIDKSTALELLAAMKG